MGAGFLLVFALIILGSVISVGERLARIHPFVEIGFYLLILFALYFLVIRQVLLVLFAPVIPVRKFTEASGEIDAATVKKISRRLMKAGNLSDAERADLTILMQRGSDLREPVGKIIIGRLETMDVIIQQQAVLAFLSTAVSQNGKLDGIAVLIINFNLVKQLTQHLGFRPSLAELIKMYTNIFFAALVATSLEDFDEMDEIFGQLSTMLVGSTVPGFALFASSALQGMGSSLLTLRIGYMTKNYLNSAGETFIRAEARRSANRQAVKQLLPVMKEATTMLPGYLKSSASMFFGVK